MMSQQVEKHAMPFCSHVGFRGILRAALIGCLSGLPGVGSLAATVGSPPFVGENIVFEDVTSTGSVFSSPDINRNASTSRPTPTSERGAREGVRMRRTPK